MSLEKRPVDLPTLEVDLTEGRLAGHTVIMRAPAIDAYLALRGDEKVQNATIVEWILDAVVDDSFDLPKGVRSLDYQTVLELLGPWIAAWEESVLPPATGRRSAKPSRSSPSTVTPAPSSPSSSASGVSPSA